MLYFTLNIMTKWDRKKETDTETHREKKMYNLTGKHNFLSASWSW